MRRCGADHARAHWSESAGRFGVAVVGKTSGVTSELATAHGRGSAEVEHGWHIPGEVMGRTAVVDFGSMHRPTGAKLSVDVALPWSCRETDRFNCDSLRTAPTTGSFSVALYERSATNSDLAEAKGLPAGAREESMSTYMDKCAPCPASAQACLAADQTPATWESQFSECRFPLTDPESAIR